MTNFILPLSQSLISAVAYISNYFFLVWLSGKIGITSKSCGVIKLYFYLISLTKQT